MSTDHSAKKVFQEVVDIESQKAFEKALEKYNKILEEDTKIIESSQTFELYYDKTLVYYDKALVLDELKRYKEAIESLDKFLENNPKNAKAWLKKGTILFKIAKDEGIKTTFEEPKTETENEKISCEKEITRIKAAKDALKKSICHIKIDEAIETTSKEQKTENENEKISCEKEITRIEAAKDALKKSIWYFKILIDENPKNPDHWYNRGTAHSSLAEVLIKTRDYQGALNEYEKSVNAFDYATTLNPNFALAWNNKGNAYMELKKYNKAIEAFEKAFEINPNYYLALHNKGDALYSLGKYNEAIDVYKEVITKDEKQSGTTLHKSWNDKGLALYKLERYDEAIEAFKKALNINPSFAEGWINKGLVFYKLEMLSDARTAFEEALKIEPGNARASNNLGVVLAREGELDRAKKLFENTIQEDPDFILAHANLAELLLNSGGIEEASKNIKNIQIDDKNPDPNMGYIHFLDGRIKIEDMESKEKKYSDAVKSFEKASSFNVDEPKFLLWSVYAKYLCQKFETGGKTDSSEESKTGEEKIPSKTEDICSNELSHSIVCDLEKVLNFCNIHTEKDQPFTEINKISLLNYFVLFSIFLLISAFLLKIVELFWNSLNQIFKFLNGDLIYCLLLIIFLCLVVGLIVGLIVILRLSYLTLDSFEKDVLNKRLVKPFHKVDQLVKSKIFEFEWLLQRFRSYIRFILNSQLLDLKADTQKCSNKKDGSDLSAIKVKQYIIKFDKYKEIKAYPLYLQGYFYFKLQDYTTAKEKLKECINLRPDVRTDKAAKELLDNIWKHKIKPPFWTYWFNSPVNTWRRRVFSTFVILGILSILFVHAENPQPVDWNNSTSKDYIPSEINFYPYIISYSNNTTSDLTGSLSNDNNANDEKENDNNNINNNVTWNNNGNNNVFWNNLTPASEDIYLYYPANNTTSDLPSSSSNDNNANDENDNNNINNNTTWNILIPASMNIYPDIPDNYFDTILLLILILILISPSIRITETIKIVLKKGVDVSLDLGPIAAPPEFNFELSPSLMLDVIKRLDENL